MAEVYSYSDIPGGVTDIGTCNSYAERCSNESWNYTQIFTDYTTIKGAIDDVISSLADAIETTDTIKGHFENGAYNDGVTDFVGNLSTSSSSLNETKTNLETISSELASALSEIASFVKFCKDRGNTWVNAGNFLELEAAKDAFK